MKEKKTKMEGNGARAGLQEVTIAGWAQSKAANEPDRGVAALIAFLERRSTMNREKWATAKGLNRVNPIRIKKVG